jgi:SAM-dependent methyltransferase
MTSTQEKIFAYYKEIRGDFLDVDDERIQHFFCNLLKFRYLQHIEAFRQARLLEIGCNKGYMLHALEKFGFTDLTGIDLSEGDLTIARGRTKISRIIRQDLFEHLSTNCYDVILCKDVMEHIDKSKQEKFVKSIYNSLNPGGVAIIQVPNMDWFMSNHERYMDFTHEIGYTRESLGDIFRLYFPYKHVNIYPVSYIFQDNLKRKVIFGFIRPVFIKILRFLFKLLGEGANDTWFEYREIMVVVKK